MKLPQPNLQDGIFPTNLKMANFVGKKASLLAKSKTDLGGLQVSCHLQYVRFEGGDFERVYPLIRKHATDWEKQNVSQTRVGILEIYLPAE